MTKNENVSDIVGNTDASNNGCRQGGSGDEAGGFIVDDPELSKSNRRRSRRLRDQSNHSSDLKANENLKARVSSSSRKSALKAKRSLKEISDGDDDDPDFDSDEYVPENEEEEEGEEEEEVEGNDGNVKREGRSNDDPIDLSLEDNENELDDVPLSTRANATEASRKRRKTTSSSSTSSRAKKAKDKKPKISYHERITNKLFDIHTGLADVFPKLASNSMIKPERAIQPEGMTIKLLPFQLEGLNWLIKQEAGEFGGGVLADEMGMGKTIQTIALFMNDCTKRPNLVIAPTVALIQWKNEIEQHTGGKLKVCVFHGANRAKNAEGLEEFDVVLTSYSVLESVYRRQNYGFRRNNKLVKSKSPLHSTQFYRVILDEAHNIKDRNSGTSRAANMLNTKKRWCLSGTPLQNRIGEMYSLIRYMKLFPFCEYFCTKCKCRSTEWRFSDRSHCDGCGHPPMLHTNFFNHFMLKNIQKYGIQGDGLESFENIRLLLKNIMLRRTKVERADDLGLPPRIVEIRSDYFNEEEKDLYQSLYSDSKRKFNDYVAEGVVLNNYANIFTLLTRMRQLADHPDLVLRRATSNNGNDYLAASGVIVCQLCDDEAEDAIESKCHHKFCRMCISEYVESFDGDIDKELECPVCHIGLSIDLSAPAIENEEAIGKKSSIINRIRMDGDWRSSTKIEALVEELYKLRNDRQTIKSIVFSQFTSMLDLVEWRLKRAGFQTVKLQGSMSPQQRDNSIRYFMENPQVEVFLVSLKAGGVALNLCEASQVFILDPWWNPSVEWQSGDRVHRIGQHRPVKITRFCIEDSIEARIIELQDKKANMINATINHDDAAINRLTPGDLQFLFMN
ncbi:hypothetical protein PACTADRAFT_41696 [Pachysolen tannophilus NRRL Y-2460]|uniref:DNA repair protein RAD16 n=1 Tax=Pachysolen tannophilus NRRL Y-2460 TaxID=669874 RepID=A0A1E4TXG7_PACTA|nr:hypothetical protein PACTADRAFT_41696 [Pachysolen tannophilus NRRL Y-2460]